jgi:hypothetical protein
MGVGGGGGLTKREKRKFFEEQTPCILLHKLRFSSEANKNYKFVIIRLCLAINFCMIFSFLCSVCRKQYQSALMSARS